jgi:hypothetical protein
MDTVSDRPWTTDAFLAWEDKQEGKHEFDGAKVIPTTGGSFAHQDIVFNLRTVLALLLADRPFRIAQEMRLRIDDRVRYPDVLVCGNQYDQSTRTVTDAIAVFEVLSDDTASVDRVDKLIDHSLVPSLTCYVLLEQTRAAATLMRRVEDGPWIASAHDGGRIASPGLDVALPLADVYKGLTFAS